MHEHDRRSRRARAQDLVFGEVLRTLVVPEEMIEMHQGVFGHQAALLGDADRSHRARVDDALALRAFGRAQHVQRAADVHVVEELGIRSPELVYRGEVEHGRDAGDGLVERGRIANVADDAFDRQTGEVVVGSSRFAQRPDPVAVAQQCPHDR